MRANNIKKNAIAISVEFNYNIHVRPTRRLYLWEIMLERQLNLQHL